MKTNATVWLTVLIVAGSGCADDEGTAGAGDAGAEAGFSGGAAAGSGGSAEDNAPGSGGSDGSGVGGAGGSEPGGSGGSSNAGGSPTPEDDAGTETDSGADAGPPVAIVGGVPDTDYCRPVSDWDPEWSGFEEQALQLINERREQGGDCGAEGSFEPSAALKMNPMLRCSARLHATDMAVQGYFKSESPNGRTFMDRIKDAGYVGINYSENIGTGYASPAALIDALMRSDKVCANLMSPDFADAAVGFYQPENADGSSYDKSRMWAIDLASTFNPS